MHGKVPEARAMLMIVMGFIVLVMATGQALAAGTASGTVITNTATARFQISGTDQPAVTGSTSFVVDNKVNLTVTKLADATVPPGSTDQTLSLRLTNNGNTAQRYALSVVSRVTDSFDMSNVRIYRDVNTNNVYDAGTDTLYVDAGTFGDIAADGVLRVLIVADTPGGQTNGQTAVYDLVATTVDAGTTNVTAQTIGGNTAGVDVAFADAAGNAAGDAARDGKHSSFGTFTVSAAVVSVRKSVAVIDQFGGNATVAGATLRYTIRVSVAGTGTAVGVVVGDLLPPNTTYLANTLRLNGTALTDAADADAGDVAGTVPGAVTVRLGDLASGSPVQSVIFDVMIN